ncbi:MerR family transcriptional regulator [Kurthia gibsonii]|uniref:MerR family transcriptional regulator n=1 Tax=Kurthia gibsonii TaxID=33946 RepID=A0ABU9LNJ9_9BACL
MMKKEEKTFSTGEFAKLVEVNKDTLLYYDKINLFKPAGIHANGYRYYTFKQFDQFMAIHSLRDVEVPIKELKSYFTSPNVDDLQNLAEYQKQKVADEIKKLKDIQFFLQRVLELTEELKQISFDEIRIEKLPERPIIYSKEKLDWSLPIEELYQHSTQFLKELGVKGIASYGGVVYEKDHLLQEQEGLHRLFCYIDLPEAEIQPGGLYATIYYQGLFDFIEESYKQFVDHLAAHNLDIIGDLYEEYILHSLLSLKEEDYITKISVRVQFKK